MGRHRADRPPYDRAVAIASWAGGDWRYLGILARRDGIDPAREPADLLTDWLYVTMIDELSSAFAPRIKLREKVDAALDEVGGHFAGRLVGKTAEQVDRERWGEDLSNEAGAKAMQQVAAMIGAAR